MRQSGTLYYLLSDHLGSSTNVLDANGNLVPNAAQKYYPYGRTRSTTSVTTDKQFTGHQREQDDLYFMQARFYDPFVGRFLAPDSIVPDPANPQALNRYSYVYGNPLRYTNPTGHCAFGAPCPPFVERAAGAVGSFFTQTISALARQSPSLFMQGAAFARGYFLQQVSAGIQQMQDTIAGLRYLAAIARNSPPGQVIQEQASNAADLAQNVGVEIKDAARSSAHTVVDTYAFYHYGRYYVAYQSIGLLNRMPGHSEVLIKAAFPGIYLSLLRMEASGLAHNALADAAERHILRYDESAFDDRRPKKVVPGFARWAFERAGIPVPVRYAPGIDEDLNVDFNY